MKNQLLLFVLAAMTARCLWADFHDWAATPPMGWNSWDCYGAAVNESEFKANVDVLAAQRDGRNPKPLFCTKDACAIASDNANGGKFLALFNLKKEAAEVSALDVKRRLPPHGSALLEVKQ